MKRILPLILLALVSTAGRACARTWYIKADGTGDAPTIQAGIDSASSGDTVLVAAGRYFENILMKKGLHLLGEGGDGSATLEPATISIPIINCSSLPVKSHIRGFSFENAHGPQGAAVKIHSSSIDVVGNRFKDGFSGGAGGAAIACIGAGDVRILGNEFESNVALDRGGAINCAGSRVLISGNVFINCRADYGGAIGALWGAPIIVRNRFLDNIAWEQGGAVHCDNPVTLISLEDNLFTSNLALGSGGAVICMRGDYKLTNNVFCWNSATNGGGLSAAIDADVLCENNTFWGHRSEYPGVSIWCSEGSTVRIRKCIIGDSQDRSAICCFPGSDVTIEHNFLWANAREYSNCHPDSTNWNEDPLLCNPANGNFDLQECSPCIDGYGYGRVGARPAGCSCGGVQTESTTWGRLKAMYR